ncbi:hypothetical protein DSECCO2_477370 [anaerobic digester metagenome]
MDFSKVTGFAMRGKTADSEMEPAGEGEEFGTVVAEAQAGTDGVSASCEAEQVEATRLSDYFSMMNDYFSSAAGKLSSIFRETFEIDKSAEEIVDGIRKSMPAPVSSVNEIFDACKREALQRAMAAFGLSEVMVSLDARLEKKFDDLSMDYAEFRKEHNLHSSENFKAMHRERDDSKEQMLFVEDGYNSANLLDPHQADIEHVISKNEYFDSFLLRAGTDAEGLIEAMNVNENLIYADKSFNRSKGNTDLLGYMARHEGTVDQDDSQLVHYEIQGKDVVINEKDVRDRYEAAQREMMKSKTAAAKELGVAMASSGARLAVQQVVGLILVETIDIFVDEIRDMSVNGNLFKSEGLLAQLQSRASGIGVRLRRRFEERDIFARARSLGIESGIAGVLGILPQIFLSILFRMPAFILSIIRECTLSAVRCVRILLTHGVNRYESIKIVMAGTVTAVMGVYIARIISVAVSGVPLLNAFNRQATEVLTGVFVTSIPLSAIYCFEKNKHLLTFRVRESAPAVTVDPSAKNGDGMEPVPECVSGEGDVTGPGLVQEAQDEETARPCRTGVAGSVRKAGRRAMELLRLRDCEAEAEA